MVGPRVIDIARACHDEKGAERFEAYPLLEYGPGDGAVLKADVVPLAW